MAIEQTLTINPRRAKFNSLRRCRARSFHRDTIAPKRRRSEHFRLGKKKLTHLQEYVGHNNRLDSLLAHFGRHRNSLNYTSCRVRRLRKEFCFRFTEPTGSVKKQRMQSCFTLPKKSLSRNRFVVPKNQVSIHTPTVCWDGWGGSAANTIMADSKRFSWTISLTTASYSINFTR